MENGQSFWKHIADLRRCLLKVIVALMLGFIGSLFLSKQLLALIAAPAGELVFIRPAEALLVQLKIALINGIIISLPVNLWLIGRFLWPALYPKERKLLWLYLPAVLLLFGVGMGFGYYIMVRIGYSFLLSFAIPGIQPLISLDTYVNFVLYSMLTGGFVFIIPVLILFLAKIGLIKAAFLWRQQRILIIGLVTLLAIITPTVDMLSLLIIFIPVLILFELSIFLAWRMEKRRNKTITGTANYRN